MLSEGSKTKRIQKKKKILSPNPIAFKKMSHLKSSAMSGESTWPRDDSSWSSASRAGAQVLCITLSTKPAHRPTFRAPWVSCWASRGRSRPASISARSDAAPVDGRTWSRFWSGVKMTIRNQKYVQYFHDVFSVYGSVSSLYCASNNHLLWISLCLTTHTHSMHSFMTVSICPKFHTHTSAPAHSFTNSSCLHCFSLSAYTWFFYNSSMMYTVHSEIFFPNFVWF